MHSFITGKQSNQLRQILESHSIKVLPMNQNMLEAYAVETKAYYKFAAFSKKAAEELHPELALLFKAASNAKLIQANNLISVLVSNIETIPEITPEFKVNATRENLKESLTGLNYEFHARYPEFIEDAIAACNYMAQITFTYAIKVEIIYRDLFREAMEALEAGTDDMLADKYFLCPTCGNTYASEAPSRCEISMTDSYFFIEITN